ncbi:MAG: 30S ribosomal protein S8 [Pseudomonadota bacterium]|jgi:small subunit ribosomal protein S8|nr:30S ribosomal protein S8 [Pseudomonadales bacterium]MDP7403833.1 30S ribosomal protein S8 [Porticoccaceae bacterium]MEC7157588.1 30S ribosomal protein S8 [Pseudomonadota bacterium]MEC8212379.1 30S ribosomal protein S8 [Pseudomonadota bacterium]MED6345158.1 30S ribosomal protein S8 [Pseudomonadota bacterium]
MTMQDPLSDMITRIRNANLREKVSVAMPSSKVKVSVAKVLKDEGYILNYKVTEDKKPVLEIDLKYYDGKPVIEEITRSSKPSLRVYSSSKDLPKVKSGLGVAIVSTSKGVMSDRSARSNGVGGEILCTVF